LIALLSPVGVGQAGTPIYDFDASYTLLDVGEQMKITAIAHNETARLGAALGTSGAARDHSERRGT
jgi:hypothetical protein